MFSEIMMRYSILLMTSFLQISALSGCGKNMFKDYDKKDPAEDAVKALEDKNPDKAIQILLDELGWDAKVACEQTSPEEITSQLKAAVGGRGDGPKLVSLLSAAYAQKIGLDPLELALKMAENKSSENDGNSEGDSQKNDNGLTALFPVLPPANAGNIEGLDRALAILNAIEPEKFTAADYYKQALLMTASMALRSKMLDMDGDGIVSATEILAMSADDATTILSQLDSATEAMNYADTNSESIAAVATQMSDLQTAIDSQPGETDEEKLKNYLAANNNTN